MRGEQGVAPAQEVDLARGVPPGKDHGILRRMLGDGGRQCGKLGELAVQRDQQFAGAVLPVKQDGRALAAPCGVARGQRLLHAFGMDFIAGNGQDPGQASSPSCGNWAAGPSSPADSGRAPAPGLNHSQANQASKRIPPVTRRMPSDGRSLVPVAPFCRRTCVRPEGRGVEVVDEAVRTSGVRA